MLQEMCSFKRDTEQWSGVFCFFNPVFQWQSSQILTWNCIMSFFLFKILFQKTELIFNLKRICAINWQSTEIYRLVKHSLDGGVTENHKGEEGCLQYERHFYCCGALTLTGHQIPTKQLYHSPPHLNKAE